MWKKFNIDLDGALEYCKMQKENVQRQINTILKFEIIWMCAWLRNNQAFSPSWTVC